MEHEPSDTDLLTVATVAELIGASEAYVLREINRGNLCGKKIGNVGGWRIRRADYDAWLATPTTPRSNKKADEETSQ